jgi:SAM-dependent methyltransferase
MIQEIEFAGQKYPAFQGKGFAAEFAFPFAQKVCHGKGYDIGCNRKEWSFPGSIPIDPAIPGCEWDAFKLPETGVDYIFSSHCLEHLPDWVGALDQWSITLRDGGVLFLYLPDYRVQQYWRPWNNRKHLHAFTPQLIKDYLTDRNYRKIYVSESDLNGSFMVFAENTFPGRAALSHINSKKKE